MLKRDTPSSPSGLLLYLVFWEVTLFWVFKSRGVTPICSSIPLIKFGPNHNNIILKKLGQPPKFHPTIKLRKVVWDLEYFHE
jgi:hypothetical protein